jgi:hypothetical protein
MSDTLSPEEQERIIQAELVAAAVAADIQKRYGDVPTNIMSAAINIIVASILVDRANYVSQYEMEQQRILTDEEHLKIHTDDIKMRADNIRMLMKTLGVPSRARPN